MKKYFSPFVILATGTISMTDSQLGELGIEVDVAAWDDEIEAAAHHRLGDRLHRAVVDHDAAQPLCRAHGTRSGRLAPLRKEVLVVDEPAAELEGG